MIVNGAEVTKLWGLNINLCLIAGDGKEIEDEWVGDGGAA